MSRLVRSVSLLALVLVAACSSDAAESESPAAIEAVEPTAVAIGDTLPLPDTGPTTTETATTETATSETATTGTAAVEPTGRVGAYDFSAIGPIVDDFVAERGLNGAGLVVVERDDGVVHEEYWGDFDADRISLIASSSKMITAGVLLHLQDAGMLEIDAPVADVVEWGSSNPAITPAQLLSNSSGLVGLLPDPTYGPYICQYLAHGTLQDCAEQVFATPDDDVDIVTPDTEFRYGGAQWSVAGAVAEVASGESWADLIQEIYVEPCGVDSLAYNNHFAQMPGGFDYPEAFDGDPSTLVATDNPNMEGGAYITAPDYAQLLLMHLSGGKCGETQVLSPESLDVMHSDRIGPEYAGNAGAAGSGGDGTGYGMGWWVDRESGRISDGGAYGTVPWLELDDGYGAYLVIEADAGTGAELAELLYDEVRSAVVSAA